MSEFPEFVQELEASFEKAQTHRDRRILAQIVELANQQPYYKYNGMWSRQMETASYIVVLMGWLGVDFENGKAVRQKEGRLCTYEEVAQRLGGILGFYEIVSWKYLRMKTIQSFILILRNISTLSSPSSTNWWCVSYFC